MFRELATPVLPDGWPAPDAVVLRADLDARRGCLEVGGAVRCAEERTRTDEEATAMDRVVTLPASAHYQPSLLVVPRSSVALTRMEQRGLGIRVAASSVAVPDPRAGPLAAVDGDPGTTWLAEFDDVRPNISLRWLGQQSISGLDVQVENGTAARAPTELELTWPGGSREVKLEDGRATFSPIRTDQLRISVEASENVFDLDFDAQSLPVGIGISELRLDGSTHVPLGVSAEPVDGRCGSGPVVMINGTAYSTAVVASAQELFRGIPVPATLCGGTGARSAAAGVDTVSLLVGENHVSVRSTRAFQPTSLVLLRQGASLPPAASVARPAADSGSVVARRLQPADVPAGGAPGVIELRQNSSVGWQASQGGRRLTPLVLDGWQQGWALTGNGPVTARFAPDGLYRTGLVVGLALLAVLVGLVVLFMRRERITVGPPPLAARELPLWGTCLALALGVGLMAGWVGVLVAGLTAVAVTCAPRRWGSLVTWVVAAPCLVVAVAYALRPWGSANGWAGQDAWTSYLMLVPLAGVLLRAAEPVRRHTPFRRRTGRSTKR